MYLCPTVFWKVELVNSETRYSAEDSSKRSVKGAAWLLLNAYSKMTAERNDLKIKWVREVKSLSILEEIINWTKKPINTSFLWTCAFTHTKHLDYSYSLFKCHHFYEDVSNIFLQRYFYFCYIS